MAKNVVNHCLFCGGNFVNELPPSLDGKIKMKCIMCGRSDDYEYEVRIRRKQRIYGLTDYGAGIDRDVNDWKRKEKNAK